MPLLEREREIALASESLDASAVGEVGLLVLEGRPGAGKSAMLGGLESIARERGFTVLRASGFELERGYPFGVVRQLFEPVVFDLDEPGRRELFAGAASLAEGLVGPQAEPSHELADPGFGLLHSLYWMVVGLIERGPLVLVVDDLHWADALSLRFLAFVVQRGKGLPLLVAGATRTISPTQQSPELGAVLSSQRTVITLAPLSTVAIRSLLQDAVGSAVDDAVVAEASDMTEGIPLYVRELADSLGPMAASFTEDQLGTLRKSAPAAIARRVQMTLGRLAGSARAIATSAAILGTRFRCTARRRLRISSLSARALPRMRWSERTSSRWGNRCDSDIL